jgi:Protein of unknown function with HXXEE motif
MRNLPNSLWPTTIAVFALHNAEEVLVFSTGWSDRHLPSVGLKASDWLGFAALTVFLTAAIATMAWALRNRPKTSSTTLKIFLWIMLLNVAWHAGVSIYTSSLAPGAITALLLVLPIYALFLLRLNKARSTNAA